MHVRCERCQTDYDLDPSRVPAAGLAVRCRCGHVFRVRRRPPAPAPADFFAPPGEPAAPARQGPAPAAQAAPSSPARPVPVPAPAAAPSPPGRGEVSSTRPAPVGPQGPPRAAGVDVVRPLPRVELPPAPPPGSGFGAVVERDPRWAAARQGRPGGASSGPALETGAGLELPEGPPFATSPARAAASRGRAPAPDLGEPAWARGGSGSPPRPRTAPRASRLGRIALWTVVASALALGAGGLGGLWLVHRLDLPTVRVGPRLAHAAPAPVAGQGNPPVASAPASSAPSPVPAPPPAAEAAAAPAAAPTLPAPPVSPPPADPENSLRGGRP